VKPAAGVRLGGRYELRKRLAVGGMGEVWLTRDLSLGRSVATKVLRPELAADERFLSHLRAEARASAPLAHPNIATLYDYGEDDDGAGYLVMELVAGEPLSDVLARERVLAPEVLLAILAQAARALHAAHVCGVVHRDVKPSNILLTPDGRVKVTDFGVSASPGTAPSAPRTTVHGTVHYLAPEQVLGRGASPASDIYSLGVVAFEAATGHRPFTGRDRQEIAHAHLNQPVPELPGHLPSPMTDLVRRMLEKNPERRPRSAASLARSIERVLKQLELAQPVEDDAVQDDDVRLPVRYTSSGWALRDGSAAFDGRWPAFEEPGVDTMEHQCIADGADRNGSTRAAPDDHLPSDRSRHRHRGPRRPPTWVRLVGAAADVMTAVVGLGAYRLAASVVSGRGGAAVLRLHPARATPAPARHGSLAVGRGPQHQTEVEDGSW
jgi:serine/threonine protein kinase